MLSCYLSVTSSQIFRLLTNSTPVFIYSYSLYRLVFILIEKENKFVRFHVLQLIIVFGILTLASIVIRWIPIIGWVISGLIGVLAVVLWIVLMVKAYQGEKYKLPWAGDLAEKNA